jgi:gliding-associated putative ABC transporter substrate-binding component GldG
MNKLFQQSSLFIVAVVGSLVLINLIGLRLFGRIDFTQDHAYTLSKASKETLAGLEDPVTVKAYFTDKLPPPYSANARYVRDLLEEFRAASHGKLSFEFIDPMEAETDLDKAAKRDVKRDIFGRRFREPTTVEKELAEAGVQPVEIRVVEEDQVQTKRAYMGVQLNFGDKKEVIPVVQDLGSLEYDLTSLLKKLTRKKTPVLAVLQGHDEPKLQEKFGRLQTTLSGMYTLRPLDLQGKDAIPEDVDALMVLGPKTPVKPNELKAIDQFLMKGKSVGFFLDSVEVDTRTFQSQPADHGLAGLLQTYGITIGDKLVADVQSAQLNVQERRGFMVVSMPVPYPFIPELARLERDSPITKGLSGIAFPFASSITTIAAEGRQVAVLARSSPKSWLEQKPYNVDPRRDWRQENITASGPYDLMVQVTGKLQSHFATEANAATSTAGPHVLGESQGEPRIIVAGTAAVLEDDFMSRSNQALALNIADWLMQDASLLQMRSRGLAAAPLQTDLSDGTRNGFKFGNALGVPLALALFGVVRWRMRESRRATVKV